MNELARHLTHEGSHGDLPFHASCAVCREERLSGRLTVEPLISHRAQAGLAAAVLAGSAAVPSVAAATTPVPEQETEAEGTHDSEDPSIGDIDGTDPGSGSGVDTPVGSQPVGDVGPAAGDDDGGPLESAEPGDAGADDDSLPPGTDVEPPAGAGATTPPVPPAPAAPALPVPDVEDDEPVKEKRAAKKGGGAAQAPQAAPAPHVTQADEAVPVPVPAPVAPATTGNQAAAASAPADPSSGTSGRTHTVQPGESLWTIASDRLGAGAGTAEIAREVQRIWDLNAGSIGTGDPDLVIAGQELRLK